MGAPGGKASSRKGVPNKRTQEMLAKLDEHFPGYDPVLQMAGIAQTATIDAELNTLHLELRDFLTKVVDHLKRKGDKQPCQSLIEQLTAVIDEPSVGIDHRITCMKEVANYIHPKRKAIEHSNDPENPLEAVPTLALLVGHNGSMAPVDLNTVLSKPAGPLPAPTVIAAPAEDSK